MYDYYIYVVYYRHMRYSMRGGTTDSSTRLSVVEAEEPDVGERPTECRRARDAIAPGQIPRIL